MAIPDGHRTNFETLERAFRDGRVCLLDCQDRASGDSVAVICAVNPEDDGQTAFVPFARLFEGNPYEELCPPDPDGGYHNDG